MVKINRNPELGELRLFAAVFFPATFAVLGTVLGRKFGVWNIVYGVWAVVAVVAVVGAIVPRMMKPIYIGMTMAVFPIGWVVSHVILGAVYFVVMTPIGLVMRAAGRDPMERKLKPEAATYWEKRDTVTDKKKYFRQF